MFGKEHYEIELAELINSFPGHVYWHNKDGVVLGCNEEQARSYHCQVHELIGKTIQEVNTQEVAAQLLKNNAYVIETGQSITIEEFCISPKGEELYFLSKKRPLKDASGQVIGVLGISFDVTAARRQERQREQLLQHIIDLMPGHVYWKDRNCRYLGCNHQQALSAGLGSANSIIGKSDFELPWGQQAIELNRNDLDIMESGVARTIEEFAVNPDGHIGTFLSKKVPLKDANGNVIGILGISFDITDQKNTERLEKAKAVAEEKARTAKVLAASIAHELRTPLVTINSLSNTLEALLPGLMQAYQLANSHQLLSSEQLLGSSQLEFVAKVPASLQQVTRTANTFIDMMLMKVNPETAKPQELVLLGIINCVNRVIELYPFTQHERKLLSVDLKQDFVFRGDDILFRHVLFNLLKNAVYYVRDAGKGAIFIWTEAGIDKNYLHFKDTGKGIAADILPKIFGQFFSNTRHGTGVGLALCKIIMQEFGGNIGCESIEGEYTHFILEFPKV